MRYDWTRGPKGTAYATLWFVLFFFPVIPLRREHLKVQSIKQKDNDLFWALFAALFGFVGLGGNTGFKTKLKYIGPSKPTPLSILLTYIKGWIVVPIVLIFPFCAVVFVIGILGKAGFDIQKIANGPFMIIFAVFYLLWMGCVVAWILDRSAGRHLATNDEALHSASKTPQSSKPRRLHQRRPNVEDSIEDY